MEIEEAIAQVKSWEEMKCEPDEDYQTEGLEALYHAARMYELVKSLPVASSIDYVDNSKSSDDWVVQVSVKNEDVPDITYDVYYGRTLDEALLEWKEGSK